MCESQSRSCLDNVSSLFGLTIELVERGRDGFDACLAAQWNSESSFKRWNHDREMYIGVTVKGSIEVRLSKVVAMFMCEMVGWFVMRAASQPAPGHARHLARALLRRRSEVFEVVQQSRRRNPLPLANTDITHTTTTHRATSLLDSNSREKYHTPAASPTDQS